jgi:ankyrin repeat protein
MSGFCAHNGTNMLVTVSSCTLHVTFGCLPACPFSLVDPSIHLLGQEGGASPLYMASEGGHVDTVSALLDLGADVHKAQVRVHVLVRR